LGILSEKRKFCYTIVMAGIENYFNKKPKEKILFLPSEYVTIGLIGIFVLVALGGILFISSRTSSNNENQSVPLASGNALATVNQSQQVPTSLPPQASVVPTLPKATSTPKPSATASPNPTVDCVGPDGKHFSATKSQCDSFTKAWATPSPSPTTASSSDSSKTVNLTMGASPGTTINNGDQVTVNLNIDTTSSKADGAELHLKFDQTKLQAQSFTVGSFMGSTLVSPTYDNGAGTATVTVGTGLSGAASGTGTLATIVFKATSSGSVSLSYESNTQTTYAGNNNLNSTSGTTITIN
jgi:hypothetical protein